MVGQFILLIGLLVLPSTALMAEDDEALSRERIDRLVKPVLQDHPWATVAIAIRGPGGEEASYGYGILPENTPPHEVLFQIGSVTKLFTALLLADTVVRGEMQLSDPVSRYLPADLAPPPRGAHSITLAELATHTSGLPRLPPSLHLAAFLGAVPGADPYSTLDYNSLSLAMKLCWMSEKAEVPYSYSNFGMGLLGHALSHQAGLDYEALLKERITGPLEMPDTVLIPTEDQRARFATGRNAAGKELPPWKFGMLEGCGGLYSTAKDLHRFLEMELGRIDSPLAAAMKLTQEPRRQAGEKQRIGLAWHITDFSGHEIWLHDGATYGHTSFVAFCTDPSVTIVVLCNEGASPAGPSVCGRISQKLLVNFFGTPKSAP